MINLFMMKIYFPIVFFLIQGLTLLGQCNPDYKSDLLINNEIEIKCDIKENYVLGEKLNFSVIIVSLEETEVFDLKTARLDFQLKKDGAYNYPSFDISTYTGGNYYISSDDMFTEIFPREQNRITLHKGLQDSALFNLNNLFPNKLTLGNYILSICYEGKAYANYSFRITLNYNLSIPYILKDIETVNVSGRYWKQVMLYSILPIKNIWYSKEQEDKSLIKTKVGILQDYWKKNKELILLINNNLIFGADTNRIDYNETIEKQLRKLERGTIEEKIDARNRLYELIKKPEWIPNTEDSKETTNNEIAALFDWWKANQELIEVVNKMLLPELFE
jgi:hypothetical protein